MQIPYSGLQDSASLSKLISSQVTFDPEVHNHSSLIS